MLMKIKKLLNKLGFDVKRHHPIYETTIMPLDIRTIVDIGANIGVYAQEMRERFPDAQIFAFEPLSDCYRAMEKRFVGDAKFKSWNVALGEKDEETTIKRSSFHPSSSLLPMSDLHRKLYPKSGGAVSEIIQVRRLDNILRQENLEKNILIKMDVQGFEDRVMRGGEETIRNAAVLIIETSFVPLYEGQPLFGDIHRIAEQLGFAYYGNLGRHWSPRSGKLLFEDSLFIKQDLIKE